MSDWLLWALFSSSPEEAKPEWKDELDGYIKEIEQILGKKFEEGRDENTPGMRLTYDEVRMKHRPLIWYCVCPPFFVKRELL